jgi:ribose 5-phosphate isomerase B
MPQIEDTIRRMIARILEIDIDQVQLDRHFINDLGANSLDIVELIMALEESFHIEIPDNMADEVRTVGDVVAYARRLIQGSAPDPSAAPAKAPDAKLAAVVGGVVRVDVIIGSDHAGFSLKEALKGVLNDLGLTCRDAGPSDGSVVDYPVFAGRVAQAVAKGEAGFGVLVCGSGVGMAIAANKVAGVRAAVLHTELEARLARQHNNLNVACFGARLTGSEQAIAALKAFLQGQFDAGDDGRHQRRIDQIGALERGEVVS